MEEGQGRRRVGVAPEAVFGGVPGTPSWAVLRGDQRWRVGTQVPELRGEMNRSLVLAPTRSGAVPLTESV